MAVALLRPHYVRDTIRGVQIRACAVYIYIFLYIIQVVKFYRDLYFGYSPPYHRFLYFTLEKQHRRLIKPSKFSTTAGVK